MDALQFANAWPGSHRRFPRRPRSGGAGGARHGADGSLRHPHGRRVWQRRSSVELPLPARPRMAGEISPLSAHSRRRWRLRFVVDRGLKDIARSGERARHQSVRDRQGASQYPRQSYRVPGAHQLRSRGLIASLAARHALSACARQSQCRRGLSGARFHASKNIPARRLVGAGDGSAAPSDVSAKPEFTLHSACAVAPDACPHGRARRHRSGRRFNRRRRPAASPIRADRPVAWRPSPRRVFSNSCR